MQRRLFILFALCLIALGGCTVDRRPVIGIAWRDGLTGSSYVGTYLAIEAMGARPILLGQVQSTELRYTDGQIDHSHIDSLGILRLSDAERVKSGATQRSNARDVMQGIDAVVLTGGEDISPTLFSNPQPWHGIEAERDYNPTRDVSDYLLLQYCIEQDVPTLCICRGAQMLAVVSGAELIQDIPTHYTDVGAPYRHTHRCDKSNPDAEQDYVSHDVTVTAENSLLHKAVGTLTIEKCPSWHHQAIGSLEGTEAYVTATTTTDGVEIVEALERRDARFVMGVQYHPEVVLYKQSKGEENLSRYMTPDEAMLYFHALKEAI